KKWKEPGALQRLDDEAEEGVGSVGRGVGGGRGRGEGEDAGGDGEGGRGSTKCRYTHGGTFPLGRRDCVVGAPTASAAPVAPPGRSTARLHCSKAPAGRGTLRNRASPPRHGRPVPGPAARAAGVPGARFCERGL